MNQRTSPHQRTLALFVVFALGVTSLASPARADSSDVAKWVAGAAALAIVGAAVARERRDRRETTRRATDPVYVEGPLAERDRAYRRFGYSSYDYDERQYQRGKRNRSRHDHYALPLRCARNGHSAQGQVYGFGRKCLRRHFKNFGALPRHCAVRLREYGERRGVIYHNGCLHRNGFYVAKGRQR